MKQFSHSKNLAHSMFEETNARVIEKTESFDSLIVAETVIELEKFQGLITFSQSNDPSKLIRLHLIVELLNVRLSFALIMLHAL